jgi:hypothetical protein
MLTSEQFQELERTLWATTGHPETYRLFRDNLDVRLALNELIRDVYKVLSENYQELKQSDNLHNLENNLTLIEEQLR